MPIFEDKHLPLTNATDDEKRDFQIAWLHRRAENLEKLVFALLRDKVHYEDLQGYKKTLENPGFGPSSNLIKDRCRTMALSIEKGWPAENLGWPPRENGSD